MSEIVFVLGCVIFVDHVHIVAHGTQEFVKERQTSYQGLPPAEASYVRSAVIFIFFLYRFIKIEFELLRVGRFETFLYLRNLYYI